MGLICGLDVANFSRNALSEDSVYYARFSYWYGHALPSSFDVVYSATMLMNFTVPTYR